MKNKLRISKTPKKVYIPKILTPTIHKLCSHSIHNFCKRSIFTSSDFTSITTTINSYLTAKDQDIFISLYITLTNPSKDNKTFPLYFIPKQSGKLYRVCLQTFLAVLGVGKLRVLTISKKKTAIRIFRITEVVKEFQKKTKQETIVLENISRHTQRNKVIITVQKMMTFVI